MLTLRRSEKLMLYVLTLTCAFMVSLFFANQVTHESKDIAVAAAHVQDQRSFVQEVAPPQFLLNYPEFKNQQNAKSNTLDNSISDPVTPPIDAQIEDSQEPEQDNVEENTTTSYSVTSWLLNVRQDPDPDSKIIGLLEHHQQIDVVSETDNHWLELSTGGYINGNFVELSSNLISEKPKNKVTIESYQPKVTNPLEVGITKDSNLTASQIHKIVHGTALDNESFVNAVVEVEKKNHVNAFFTIAVARQESANGNSTIAKNKNNLFGLNAVNGDAYNSAYGYKSQGASVLYFGDVISNFYIKKGLDTVQEIKTKYCTDDMWPTKIQTYMKKDYGKIESYF